MKFKEEYRHHLKWRESILESTIEQMLGRELKDKVYGHPLFKGLYTNQGKHKPDRIPDGKFVLVLFHEVLNSGDDYEPSPRPLDDIKEAIARLKSADGNHPLKNFAITLDTLLIGITDDNLAEAQTRVVSWLNDSLLQASFAYRRRVQLFALVIGFTIAGMFNVDTSAIAIRMWNNQRINEAMQAALDQQALQTQDSLQASDIQTLEEITRAQSLPIGWSADNKPANPNEWAAKFLGILISGIAAAQGAPYWFDFMRKLVTRPSKTAQPPA